MPSRNPKAATISSGFPSDSVERRSEGTTDDTTGSYAKEQPSFNTPSWGIERQLVVGVWHIGF